MALLASQVERYFDAARVLRALLACRVAPPPSLAASPPKIRVLLLGPGKLVKCLTTRPRHQGRPPSDERRVGRGRVSERRRVATLPHVAGIFRYPQGQRRPFWDVVVRHGRDIFKLLSCLGEILSNTFLNIII